MNFPLQRPPRSEAAIRSSTLLAAVLAIVLLAPQPVLAQRAISSLTADAERATRPELERLAAHAESLSTTEGLSVAKRDQLQETSRVARYRLQFGDFGVGDLIALWVQDQPTLTDTFTVRAGKRLQLPNMDDLNLTGVLYSELAARVRTHIAQYVRDPVVRATPLIRLSILGAVAHPGYYALPADLPVADWIMHAGGPTPTADLSKVELRHSGEKAVANVQAGSPIATGATIEQLDLRSGDAIVVGERARIAATNIIQIFTGLAGVAVAFLAMQSTRHR